MGEVRFKKAFFWFLVLVFFMVAPVVVYYAMGYRFNLEKGIFIYSGSVTIKPTPREIEVKIDGKQVSTGLVNFLNYSYHMGSLFPGKYMIEVSSPGYLPWSKEVHVHSGVSTEFWNVFLAREKYTQIEYPTQNTENFFISPDGKRIAVVEKENEKLWVKILDVKKEEVLYAFSLDNCELLGDKKENIEWSPREGRLLVPVIQDSKRQYYVINIGNEEIFNLNEKIKKDNIRKVRWSSDDRNTLFYTLDNNLYRLDLENQDNEVLAAENIFGYDLSGPNIYYLSADNKIIYRKNISGRGDIEQITTESIEAGGGDNFEMIIYDEDRIAVISQDKKLYLYNNGEDSEGVKEIGREIEGIHFSNDGKKLVFWNNNEVMVYFTRKWETQPSREEGQKLDIVRFSQPIKNVSWFKDYEHIIFSSGNQIKIVELDNRSIKNINDLVGLNLDEFKATYNQREDNLFFINKKEENKKLYSISLTEEDEE